MKKLIVGVGVAGLVFAVASGVSAQMMRPIESGSAEINDDHTKQEEAEGKEIWQKLQAKERSCADLKDGDFGALGEYFMGTMIGDSHAAMNAMITQMHGEEGEEQIHIAMGKRLSGCEINMFGGVGWRSDPSLFKNVLGKNMMGYGYGMPFGGGLGFLFMIFVWLILIVSTVGVVRWVFGGSRWQEDGSALELLKKRYAKGEIDRKEFEEKKRDLS